MTVDIEKMKALAKKFREPCGRTVGHGDSCVKGWYCGACSDKAKAADLVDELIAEVERLRAMTNSNSPEFDGIRISAAPAAGTVEKDAERFGCHCDLEPHMQPDDCVIGTSRASDCSYAHRHAVKESCEYWQPIKIAAIEAHTKQEG
jgi:hypothetical protein